MKFEVFGFPFPKTILAEEFGKRVRVTLIYRDGIAREAFYYFRFMDMLLNF
jgi:hypothetical protein